MTDGNKYELKHRVAGAVVLMVVAVVLIPLLLSDPAVEANNADGSLASANVGGRDFTSRIVPLNINNVNDRTANTALVGSGQKPAPSPDATVVADDRPALLDLTEGAETVTLPADQGSPDQSAAQSVGQNVGQNVGQSNAEDEGEDDARIAMVKSSTDAADSTAAADTRPALTPIVPESETADATSEIATIEPVKGDGWVVRVGTFSKPANVESVSTLLSSSGFEPRTSEVATSLGDSTRVWLGPYAKRETADKISERLKSLTGERGYVTRTSS